jgi:hypothetical protein
MADEIVSPARSLNALAENFLQEYVHQHPHTEFVRVCCQADGHRNIETKAVDVAAQKCINEIEERIDITEAAELPVIIRRICHRREAAFLAGTKRDKLLWTHTRHLAFVFTGDDGAKVSMALESQGIRVSLELLTRAQAQICATELADLEREAKRPLSQEQAQRFRLRRLKAQLIANLLAGGR